MKITNYNSYATLLASVESHSADKKITSEKTFQDILSINMSSDPERGFLIKNPFNIFFSNGLRALVDYDPSKLPKVKIENQQINFPKDLPFNIGEFGGKSVAMRVLSDGGMETTFSCGFPPDPESERTGKVPLAVRYADAMASRFSKSEISQANKKAHLLFMLDNYASGKSSLQQFKQDTSAAGINLRSQLIQLGMDINKEFKINGNSLIFENGELQVK